MSNRAMTGHMLLMLLLLMLPLLLLLKFPIFPDKETDSSSMGRYAKLLPLPLPPPETLLVEIQEVAHSLSSCRSTKHTSMRRSAAMTRRRTWCPG